MSLYRCERTLIGTLDSGSKRNCGEPFYLLCRLLKCLLPKHSLQLDTSMNVIVISKMSLSLDVFPLQLDVFLYNTFSFVKIKIN